MAGSYNHIIDNKGNLRAPEAIQYSLDCYPAGDVSECIEEMYGMIWWLAHSEDSCLDPAAAVEAARKWYKDGLEMAKRVKDKKKES